MKTTRFLTIALVAAWFAPPLFSEVLKVGPPGSGASFNEIQAAIDAAQNDDVILVAAGSYALIQVDKPLRILGVGPGEVLIEGLSQTAVTIRDLPAGEELVLADVRVHALNPFANPPTVRVENSRGSVVMRGVLIGDEEFASVGIDIENCQRVRILDSVLEAGAIGFATGAVVATASRVEIVDSTIQGRGDIQLNSTACPAVEAIDSVVRVWRSQLIGGDSVGKGGLPSISVGGSAVLATNSTLQFFGGLDSNLVGGRSGFTVFDGSFPGAPGLNLQQGSRALLQEKVPIEGGFDGLGETQAPDVQTDASSTIVVTSRTFPTLDAEDLRIQKGSTLELSLAGNSNALHIVLASPRALLPTLSPFVASLANADQVYVLTREALSTDGQASASIPIPSNSVLGHTLFFQSVEVAGGGLLASNLELVSIAN